MGITLDGTWQATIFKCLILTAVIHRLQLPVVYIYLYAYSTKSTVRSTPMLSQHTRKSKYDARFSACTSFSAVVLAIYISKQNSHTRTPVSAMPHTTIKP